MANLTCPSCGRELKEKSDFCPFCHSYLTWGDSGGQSEATLRTPGGEDRGPSQRAVAISVDAPRIEVTPGRPTTVRVTIENGADIVNELRVEVSGIQSDWVEASPATIALMPRSSGSVDLTLRVPEDAGLPAGEQPISVLAVDKGGSVATTEARLNVAAVDRASWALKPEVIHGGGKGKTKVEITNHGNLPIQVRVKPEDRQSGGLSFTSLPATAQVAPRQTTSVEVGVTAADRPWTGQTVRKQFVIPAPEGVKLDPPALNGTFMQRPRLSKGLIRLLSLLALLVVALVGWAIWRMVEVPEVVNLQIEDAQGVIEDAGLEVGEVVAEPSAAFPDGAVISQDPEAGTRQERGSEVDLVVSAAAVVPDLVGLTREQALREIEDANVTLGSVSEERSTEVDSGVVLAQDPAANTPVAAGAPVDLVVSLGTAVPDVVGMPQDQAVGQIEAAGLTVGAITQESSTEMGIGMVVSQSPPAGAQAETGDQVSIVVSQGTSVPDVTGMTQAEAVAALEAAALVVGAIAEEESTEIDAGVVITQEPGPGDAVDPGVPVDLVVSSGMEPVSVTIDFEDPPLGSDDFQIIDPYVAEGVTFTVESSTFPDAVVGLVKNRATSACVEPADDDQKLGSGRESLGSVGRFAFPIRADFSEPLRAGGGLVSISAVFQSTADATFRLRVFDPDDVQVGETTAPAGPPDGTCGFPGNPRAQAMLTVQSSSEVAYVVMEEMSGGRVFVVDDFTFESAP